MVLDQTSEPTGILVVPAWQVREVCGVQAEPFGAANTRLPCQRAPLSPSALPQGSVWFLDPVWLSVVWGKGEVEREVAVAQV
jgi:hypothetical protein